MSRRACRSESLERFKTCTHCTKPKDNEPFYDPTESAAVDVAQAVTNGSWRSPRPAQIGPAAIVAVINGDRARSARDVVLLVPERKAKPRGSQPRRQRR